MTKPEISLEPQHGRWLGVVVAVLATPFAFFPLVNWLPGGHAAPWYSMVLGEWTSGTAIVLGFAVVLAIVSRRVPALWRDGATESVAIWIDQHPATFGLALSVLSFAIYATAAALVFSRVPISIDELVQLVQAKTFASGRLWQPASPTPEFYSVLNMVDTNGRYYGQFPPGGPAMLSIGVLIGAPWLVGPICGAIAVAAFWAYLRTVEPRREVAIGAAALFSLAPFGVFMSASHMNHVPTLMWLVVAMAAIARAMSSDRPAPAFAFVNGFALGCAATIRPVDAFAFAVHAGVWYLVTALGNRARWRERMAWSCERTRR